MNAFFSSVHLIGHPTLPPCEFIMTGYSQYKRDGNHWYSPPFYSELGGYKMCLKVYTRVLYSFYYYVSVFVHLMRGEHDDKLKWPFQGDITIQLLNQK